MADIVLYGVPVSAFVAKVRATLDHKGLAFDERPPPGGYGSAEYRAIVPAGSVPGLVIEGRALHDSNAIMELIEEIAPEPPLMPADPFARARVRGLLGFHDTRLEPALRVLYPLVKRDWRAEPEAVDAGFEGVGAALELLEALIDAAPFATGAAPSLADLAFPCALQMAGMLAEEMERPLEIPYRAATMREAAAGLPAVARSLEIHRTGMEEWLAGFRR